MTNKRPRASIACLLPASLSVCPYVLAVFALSLSLSSGLFLLVRVWWVGYLLRSERQSASRSFPLWPRRNGWLYDV